MVESNGSRARHGFMLAVAISCAACGDDGVATGGGGAGGAPATGGSPSGGAPGDGGSGGVPATGGGGSTADGGAGGMGQGDEGAGWPTPPPNYCDLCVLDEGFPVQNVAISEASGIVSSFDHDGAYYVNNDSGDSARFFAVGGDGTDLGELDIEAGSHDDFEDIARGPCSVGQCIYVADIGDNDQARSFYTLYRVPEPDTLAPGQQTVFATQLKFEYPDGSHNAETLLIHPITGQIVVIQKVTDGSPSGIYEMPDPWTPNTILPVTRVGEFTPPQGSTTISGGDVHPLGHGILLRTFTTVLYYPANGPNERIEDTLTHTPCTLPSPVEVQGEAVGWNRAGDGYVTLSEGPGSPVNHVICTE